MRLPNGDVIPSFLAVGITPDYDEGSSFGNFSFVNGEVVAVIYPDDDRSVSKKYIEYNVYIENRLNGTGNGELLQNCPFWNPLASGADYETQVLRAAKENSWSKDDPVSDGSKVLVMYIHGEAAKAVIMGGIRSIQDKHDPGDLGKDEEIYWYRIFNGLSTLVDKNGAFTITFNGPTKNDGKLDTNKVEQSATGTSIAINKDGNLKLSTRENKQFHELNHKDGKVAHQADKEYKVTVTNGKVLTSSTGVELGDATDAMVLGDKYRNAENQLHKKVSNSLQAIQNLAITAGAQLTAAGSAAVGPLAGLAPGLNAAGAALQGMVSQIANIKTAIDTFEAQGKQYLSTKNKLD